MAIMKILRESAIVAAKTETVLGAAAARRYTPQSAMNTLEPGEDASIAPAKSAQSFKSFHREFSGDANEQS